VHADHIVEVEILLLQQHMRLSSINSTSANDSPRLRPKQSSSTVRHVGSEDHVGLIVLDRPAAFAQNQNISTIDEETAGAIPAKGAANAWWTASSEAAVVVGLNAARQDSETATVAKVKRKQLEALLNRSPIPDKSNNPTPSEASSQDGQSPQDDKTVVQRWLADSRDVKPIVSICSKRTRFVGLHNGFRGGLWAALDRDVCMRESLPQDLCKNDSRLEDPTGWSPFPHAVLEIRREGTQSAALINALDRSHLVCSSRLSIRSTALTSYRLNVFGVFR
jgi:SPX domain protein involved in polyphosphate accumulation